VYHDRRILRTFIGHNKAVRDICFRPDGRQFVSASYDKFLKIWDTETGKCVHSFETKALPYCVQFHPDPGKPNIILAGCANKRIYQVIHATLHLR
jgi:pre-mRNA-processing factor 17